jgi:outer membrane protein assembly factor BamD (BamD/ComL family)
MRPAAFLLPVVLIAVVLLPGAASAEPAKPLGVIADRDTAVRLARTRGKLIFLTVLVDNDPSNRAVIDEVFRDKAFAKIAPEFVVVYANTDDTHGKVAGKGADGKAAHVCADCPEITCRDHMLLAQNWARAFFPEVDARTPVHFVIDAEEHVVDTIMNGTWKDGLDVVPAKTVVERLKKILEKHGRGLTEAQYKAMEDAWRDAKAARARDDVTQELVAIAKITALSKDVERVVEAKKRLAEIDAVAALELAAVATLVERKEWEGALGALDKIQSTYPGTPTAESAKQQDQELQRQSDVKDVLRARELFDAGEQALARRRYDVARRKFEEVARRYPNTSYAQRATDALAGLPPE